MIVDVRLADPQRADPAHQSGGLVPLLDGPVPQ
jgi:hypothetical protein